MWPASASSASDPVQSPPTASASMWPAASTSTIARRPWRRCEPAGGWRWPSLIRAGSGQAALERVADRLQYGDPGEPLVIGGDQVPGGHVGAGVRDHVLHRVHVLVPM